MNREDIIRMAREAGFGGGGFVMPTHAGHITHELERFAALVASAEREAIVQMIDNAPVLVEYVTNDQGGCLMCGFTPKLAISAIRTRDTQ